MLDVEVTEATCTAGAPGGGSLAAPATTCPEGSTLEFTTDGTTWVTTLPTYDQMTAITIMTRCNCDTDNNMSSPISTVTTDPPLCPAITITKNNAVDDTDTQTVTPGVAATFSIEVCNTGTENLCALTLTESATDAALVLTDCVPDAATLATMIAATGDMDADFEPMECFTFSCMVSGISQDFTNTITTNAEGCESGEAVEDDDPSEVVIDCPTEALSLIHI